MVRRLKTPILHPCGFGILYHQGMWGLYMRLGGSASSCSSETWWVELGDTMVKQPSGVLMCGRPLALYG